MPSPESHDPLGAEAAPQIRLREKGQQLGNPGSIFSLPNRLADHPIGDLQSSGLEATALGRGHQLLGGNREYRELHGVQAPGKDLGRRGLDEPQRLLEGLFAAEN